MEPIPQSSAKLISSTKDAQNESGLFFSEAVRNLLRLIFAGAPLAQVLTIVAQLVECRNDGTLCSIWLPTDDERQLYCVAAPSLPGFITGAGAMLIGPKGGSCGTAVYRREPVYATDILTDPVWDVYRHRLLPFDIRAVWSQPLFTSEGKVLGTFAIHYRETRTPDAIDLELIENFSHITGIAIERHLNEESLRLERDRLHLLLEITNSMISKLNLPRLVETLSTDLLRVTRCDFCALLFPDADSGELRVTTLYNPAARGSLCDGRSSPSTVQSVAKLFRRASCNTSTAWRSCAATRQVSEAKQVSVSISVWWMKAWCRVAISHWLAGAA